MVTLAARLQFFAVENFDHKTSSYAFNVKISNYDLVLERTDLKQKHDLILDFIRWMSQDMHKIAVNNDTFYAVYKNGIAPFERFVMEKL